MITLYQFPRLMGIPNMSPFCLKVETWLRMAEIKYEMREVADPRKAPKGKLPFIKDQNELVADSSLIVRHLAKTYDINLDASLSQQEKAIAHAFGKMLEEHLYWVVIYNRWIDDNWSKVRQEFFGHMPPLVKTLVPNMIQKKMQSDLNSQGMGRHSKEDIYEFGLQDLKAVADFLGDKPYLMGGHPTTVDATLFALTCNILNVPLRSPLKDYLYKCKNLSAYNQRMGKQYFPDFFLDDDESVAAVGEG
ncbi:MAG: glutathione S-transferase family protein [Hahellaceae bacterium]|nr:glutathione S-transferase family protein [Hahellaceae bacterium]MCP5169126.1 glutathione S-transferase family protein [Hahellaceae bacterium]